MDNNHPFESNNSLTNNQWESDNEEDNEETYDALNEETFGDLSLDDNNDWEAEHEKLAKITELSRRSTSSQNDDASELSERMASSVLNDDEPNLTSAYAPRYFPVSINSNFFDSLKLDHGFANLPRNITYVQDIERNMRGGISTPVANSNSLNSNDINHSVSNARRAEDLERELTHSNAQKSVTANAVIQPPPPGLMSILQPPTIQSPVHFAPGINHVPLVAVRANGPPLNFVNSAHQPQPQGQPISLMNHMYGGQTIGVPLIPSNHPIAHNRTHNGIQVVPLPTGLPARMPALVNPPQFNFYHQHPVDKVPSRVFYSNTNCPMTPGGILCPSQIKQQHLNYSPNNWRCNAQSNIDEYAGLMTDNEKSWLASIQLLQLNNLHPYLDDYYYTVITLRRQGLSGRSNLSTQSTNKLNREPQTSKAVYMPQQFENSLGKLQVGSVTAPRKIIDMDIVDSIENNGVDVTSNSDAGASSSSSSSSFNRVIGSQNPQLKQKSILLEIETMLSTALKCEDLRNPLSGVPLNGNDPDMMMTNLGQTLLRDNKLQNCLSYLKGRKLVIRVFPYLSNEVRDEIVRIVVQNLVNVLKKDSEGCLLQTLPHIRKWLKTTDLSFLNSVVSSWTESLPNIMNNVLMLSVFATMVEHAATVVDGSSSQEADSWFNFIRNWILAAPDIVPDNIRAVVGVDPNVLRHHLQRSINMTFGDMRERLQAKIPAVEKLLSNSNGNNRPE